MGFLSSKSSSTASNLSSFTNGKESGLPVQTKLSVGSPNDPAEKEADSVARKVVENDAMKDKAQPKAENKKEDKIAKKEDKKDEVKKKEEEKIAKKDEVKKKEEDKIAKKEEKKDDIKKKSEEKKDEKISKKEEKKDDIKKKAEDKKDEKISKKEEKKDDIKKKEEDKIAKKDEKKEDKIAKKEEKPALAKSIQAKPDVPDKKAGEGTDDMDAIEQRLNATKGKGKAMETGIKASMEGEFEHDFSDVRIHTDNEAIELCQALNAQAFTHGRDVYFNAGKYDPQQTKGKELLAHELTHVVQQQRHIHRMVQKVVGGAAAPDPTTFDKSVGKLDESDDNNRKIIFDKVKVPAFKADKFPTLFSNPLKRAKGYNDSARPSGNDVQLMKWKSQLKKDTIKSELDSKKVNNPDAPDTFAYKPKMSDRDNYFLMGKIDDIANTLAVPTWNRSNKAMPFHVDHVVDLQISGWGPTSKPSWANDTGNYQLLEAATNTGSQNITTNDIQNKLKNFVTKAKVDKRSRFGSVEKIKQGYDLVFDGFDKQTYSFNDDKYWEFKQVEDAKHIEGDKLIGKQISEVENKDKVSISTSAGGGYMKGFDLKEDESGQTLGISDKSEKDYLKTYEIVQKRFEVTDADKGKEFLGAVYVTLSNEQIKDGVTDSGGKSKKKMNPGVNLRPVSVNRVPGTKRFGYIDRKQIMSLLKEWRHSMFCPIEFPDADIVAGKGIVAEGKILPELAFLNKADIGFRISDNNAEIYKQFNSGEIALPKPFKIDNCSLTVALGSRKGLSVEGQIDFGIEKVGEGYVKGVESTGEGFELEGAFNFDSKLFDPAQIKVEYKEKKWKVEGNIGIKKGKVKGIKKANATVSYEEGGEFKANGSAELDIPGVKNANIQVVVSDQDFKITGEANLEHKFIESGKVTADITKKNDEYIINLTGTAKPKIPGISSELTVKYLDGVITVEATVGYQKGMLSGSILAGFTNQAVGADGKPAGGANDNLTFYGGGQLTLKLTSWLQATAGVKFMANGKMEVLGRIETPQAINLFEKKEVKKDIFKAPTIEIPLLAIPIGSRSIGIVATIGGGAEGYASIGPGQLTQASLEVKYNPDDEANTTITGNVNFKVPAEAGIRLFIRAGIGLSVGIARVAGGIELGGALGAEAAAELPIQIQWSPSKGVVFDATPRISVQPKFKFDISAYLEAKLDLYFFEIGAEWKKTLAQYEFGPAMQFALSLPIHYEEGKDFELSADQIQFEKPNIDVGAFAKGIAEKVFD